MSRSNPVLSLSDRLSLLKQHRPYLFRVQGLYVTIVPMKFSTIGVLGGGQLGRMLAIAAHDLGMRIAILDPDRDAPAGQVADRHVIGDFRDPERIRELANGCDILTVEIEHVETEALDALARQGLPVHPVPATIRLIQDKLLQKRHLA